MLIPFKLKKKEQRNKKNKNFYLYVMYKLIIGIIMKGKIPGEGH